MDARDPPVLLGRVCSSWRTISRSTPRLWARLHIAEPQIPADTSLDGIREQKYTQRAEVIDAWLKRSGECALSISVFGCSNSFGVSSESSGPLLRTIIPFASRWRDIDIGAVSTTVLEILASVTEKDVPMLKTVHMHGISESRQQTNTQWGTLGFLNGPNLFRFSFLGACRDPLAFPLQWTRITRLSIAVQGRNPHGPPLTSQRAVEILSMCPNLRACQLLVDDRVPFPLDFPRETILELPCLRSLGITSIGKPVNRAGGLFSSISLPELRFLALQPGPYSIMDDDEDEITYFPILATSPSLETLNTSTELFSKEALAELLQSLPSTIRQLRLSGQDRLVDDDVLVALTSSSSCPNLQELHLTTSDLSEQAIVSFIKARMTTEPTKLRQVNINLVRKMRDIRPDIQAFLDFGFELEITYPPPLSWTASPSLGLPARLWKN
ncbi:hypothetical protein C8R45DRAFT_1034715 [Mycena sanguinolenta]|nr:hypothetical protein C8R45DRAFT_1034715 [Mycena sanguinolenta]